MKDGVKMSTKKYQNYPAFMALFLGLTLISSCSKKEAEVASPESEAARVEEAIPAEIWPRPKSPFNADASLDELVDSIYLRLSLEEKVGQVIQAEIQSITPEQAKKYHIGSILNGGGSMPHRIENADQSEWLKMADAFYDASMDTLPFPLSGEPMRYTDTETSPGRLFSPTI